MRITVFILLICLFSAAGFEMETRVFHLDNGLCVILRETHTVPMTSMQAWVRAGSITEGNRSGSGLSHYFEHMLFKGTAKRKPGEIAAHIHAAGGADLNAYTMNERTAYYFTVLSEFNETGLDVLSDMLMNSTFPKEEAEKEQQVIIKEINMYQDDPGSRHYQKTLESIYRFSPYRFPVIGYEELFKKLNRDDILNYYHTMYSPANTVLAVVGDFEMELMIEDVKKFFGSWKRAVIPPAVIIPEPAQLACRNEEIRADIPSPRLFLAWPAVSMYDENSPALEVLAGILGQGNTSRLHKKLVETGMAHYAAAYSQSQQYAGHFLINTSYEKDRFSEIRKIILEEITLLKTESVSDAELTGIKNRMMAYDTFRQESISAQASSLIKSYFYTGSLDFDKRRLDLIKKVTASDIKEAARRLFNFEAYSTVQMLPMKPVSEKISLKRTDFENSQKVVSHKLKNGITLLLSEDHKLPLVSASATMSAGVYRENQNNNGVSSLSAEMLMKGSADLSRSELEELINRTGCRMSSASGNNSIQLSFQSLKSGFPEVWKAFSGILKQSCFTDEDFMIQKNQMIADLKNAEKDINQVNDSLYRSLIYKNHPYSLPASGTSASMEKLSSEMVRRFISDICCGNNLTVVVIGDFNTEEMKQKLIPDLEKIPAGNLFEKLKTAVSELKSAVSDTVRLPDKKQCIIRMGFPGISITHSDRFSFSVISNLLSGLGGRLFENLRSRHSLAYSVYAAPLNGIDTGSYVFYIATVPEKKDFALIKMKEEIELLKKELISETELKRAVNKIIGSESGKLQNTVSLAESMGINEITGAGYQETFSFTDGIRKVTPEMIRETARKYFDTDRCVIAITEP